jgi:hypothetical protein
MSVTRNTLAGGIRATRDASGTRIETGAMIDELGGEAEAKILAALTHPDLPAFGSPYPGRADLLLLEVSAELIDTDNARIGMIYRVPAAGENPSGIAADQIVSVEIDSTTTTETTRLDAGGNLMINTYTGFPILAGAVSTSLYSVRKVVDAEILRPQMSVRIVQDRRTRPLELARRFVGTVNADVWSGDPARTWLCTGITAALQGSAWRTTFSLAYRPQTWRVTDAVEVAGQLPGDATPGNGIATYDVYPGDLWRDLGVAL